MKWGDVYNIRILRISVYRMFWNNALMAKSSEVEALGNNTMPNKMSSGYRNIESLKISEVLEWCETKSLEVLKSQSSNRRRGEWSEVKWGTRGVGFLDNKLQPLW